MSRTRKKSPGQGVLLVVMPFFSLKAPAPGVSLLKARLQEEGIPCAVRYFNIAFAERIGLDLYEEICAFKGDGGESFNGEWLFARELFGARLPEAPAYASYLRDKDAVGAELAEIPALHEAIGPFLEDCLQTIGREDYRVIGFSSVFEQNLASIALAERIKAREPSTAIVFGGANCDGAMGLELHRRFACIDFVCSGEADQSLPTLVKKVAAGRPPAGIPGVIRRTRHASVLDAPAQATEDLDSLPFADFSDYFRQLGRHAANPVVRQSGLPMESSRGCWWGARAKCAFCGLNDETLAFRSKSPQRVLEEIDHLYATSLRSSGRERISMTDNILDMGYFDQLLPALARKKRPVTLFFETKANLSQDQVRQLAAANVRFIQPGIESLSTPVLRMISKGVSALQNIQLLKDCSQFGVYPVWNLLYGFPGEKPEHDRQLLEMIDALTHLPPPGGCSPFELQRFSPYFTRPQDYGIDNIRPKGTYRFIYPFDDEALFNLAYHFDCELPRGLGASGSARRLKDAVASWQQSYAAGAALQLCSASPRSILLHDSRPRAARTWVELTAARRDIYDFCAQIRSLPEILAHLRQRHPRQPLRTRDVRELLRELSAERLMVGENDGYLSLAVPADATTLNAPLDQSCSAT